MVATVQGVGLSTAFGVGGSGWYGGRRRLTKRKDLACNDATDTLIYTCLSAQISRQYPTVPPPLFFPQEKERTKALCTEEGQKTGRQGITYPLPISPPKQIRETGPPSRALAMNSRVLEVQEERQAPSLWNVVRFGVDLGQGIREVWLWWGYALRTD